MRDIMGMMGKVKEMQAKMEKMQEEIAALPPSIEVFHVEHLEVPGLDAERCLIWMRSRPVD